MNTNFYNFIKRDIDAKKELISSLPTKTITNRKKINTTVDDITKKYTAYLQTISKYIVAKKKAIKVPSKDADVEEVKERIKKLEKVRFLLNPYNTYVEKMGFDSLIYEIDNYYTFNFNSLNEIINAFLDKFELAGIRLTSSDFDYTSYVHEYMESFLEVRSGKTKSYANVSKIFEQIYWANPEIIEHIELNFRKLIRTYEKKLNAYILHEQSIYKSDAKVGSYSSCLAKLSESYLELASKDSESIYDIVQKSMQGAIDPEQFKENNKMRVQAFNSLIPSHIDVNDDKAMSKVYEALNKLKDNAEEYMTYLEFSDLFLSFKNEFSTVITPDGMKGPSKELVSSLDNIIKKEEELAKLNARIYGGKRGLLEFNNEKNIKILKAKSVNIAKELSGLYKTYDIEYFKNIVATNFIDVMSADDLFTLYYSFDFFKKKAIQNVYNLSDYDKIVELSKKFDEFAANPNNVVITGISVFKDVNVPRVIANKYRLSNINLTEEDLQEENIKTFYNKIILILRTKIISDSPLSIQQICFIAQAEKIINS